MVFQFHHLKTDYKNGEKWSKMPYDFKALRNILHTWGQQLDQGGGWQALFWNNHDQPRALNRFGDVGKYRVKSAEMLAAAIHLSRGTPYIYMGEEIGMTDPHYHSMADYVDVEAKNAYQALLKAGKSEKEAFAIILAKARDNSRTPMQWDDTANAGFTTGTPWIKVGPDYETVNAKNEMADPDSVYNYYKKLIHLRKEKDIMVYGTYELLDPEDEALYVYTRTLGDQKLLVMCNFTKEEQEYTVPETFAGADVLISNYPQSGAAAGARKLRAYEAVVLETK